MKQKYLDGITITKENRDQVKEELTKILEEDKSLKIEYYDYNEVTKTSSWKEIKYCPGFWNGSTYRLTYLTDEDKAMKFENPELAKAMQKMIETFKHDPRFKELKEMYLNWLIALDYRLHYNPHYDENDPNCEN